MVQGRREVARSIKRARELCPELVCLIPLALSLGFYDAPWTSSAAVNYSEINRSVSSHLFALRSFVRSSENFPRQALPADLLCPQHLSYWVVSSHFPARVTFFGGLLSPDDPHGREWLSRPGLPLLRSWLSLIHPLNSCWTFRRHWGGSCNVSEVH